MLKEAIEHTKIYSTMDYSRFKKIGSNRAINRCNYSKLLRSMKEEVLVIPICVNEKFEVIDGQHRLSVSEELGLPVYYYIKEGYSSNQMKRANLVSSNWTKDDFLNAFVNSDNENYIEFAELKESYGLNTSDLIKILSKIRKESTAQLSRDFQEGSLVLSNVDIELMTKFLVALSNFSFFTFHKRSNFVNAFLDLYMYEDYNNTHMVSKLKTRKAALTVQFSKDDYLSILANKIYSFGTNKNNIYYDVESKRIYTINSNNKKTI